MEAPPPSVPPSPRTGSPSDARTTLTVWVAWTLVTALPFAVTAWGAAQRGRFFPGTFLYGGDVYQYLSFVEQASRGAFLLGNKFDSRPFEPFFLNVEWLTVGWLATALGGRILLAFHLAGAAAGALLAYQADRVLGLAGLAGRWRGWALALVLCGGGFGWLRVLGGAGLQDVPDASYALYPWTQRLAGGPHMLLGTGLVLLGLWQLVRWRAGRSGPAGWLAVTTLLGLSRPFDMALVLGSATVLWVLDLARGRALRHVAGQAAACAWLLPVGFYDLLALRLHPSFGLYSSAQNAVPRPPLLELAVAFGPALLLGLGHLWRPPLPEAFGPLREALGAAVVTALAALVLPVGFGAQFLPALGALLLLLAATAIPRRALPLAALLVCPTSFWWLSVVSRGDWGFWPGPDVRATLAYLEGHCSPRDRLLAPEALSLYASGLTPCSVTAGHWVLTPEFTRRRAQVAAFYDPRTAPAERAAALAVWRPSLVLGPPGAAVLPGYRLAARHGSLEVWRRGP